MFAFERFRKPVTVRRYGQGSRVKGRWVEGAMEQFTITASVQPAPAEIQEVLPEGYRQRETYILYTDTLLKVVEVDKTNPDTVVINNNLFTAVKVAHWNNTILNHYKIIVTSTEKDDN